MSPEPTTKGSAPNPAPAAQAATAERGAASIRYIDRADMVETFADSVTGLIFDGQTLRIEFGVTRFDDVKTNSPNHRTPLSGQPPGVAAGRGRRSHQSHAADRSGADASGCGESSAEAGSTVAESRLIGV